MTLAVERIPVTDRDSWLQLRTQDLTASDVPGWLGADPRATPMKVMARKRGLMNSDNDNAMMRGGRWLEAAGIEAVRLENPDWDVRKANVYLRAPDYRNGATPDAVAIDPKRAGIGNIQIKVVASSEFRKHWLDGGRVVAPLGYQIQSIDEAMLIDASWNCLAALVIGEYSRELYIVDVPRHEKLEAKILSSTERFWDMHDAGLWPAADYERDRAVLAARHAQANGLQTFALRDDPEIEPLLNERERVLKAIAAGETRRNAIEARIIEKMGEYSLATLKQGRISFKNEWRAEYWLPERNNRVLRISWKPTDIEEFEND